MTIPDEILKQRRRNKSRNSGSDIAGHFLVAGTGMKDPRFSQSLIYLLEHDSTGGMGIIINKVIDGITLIDLLEQLDIEPSDEGAANMKIHFGGPVELGRGFVIHSKDILLDHSIEMEHFALTTSTIMLKHIAEGNGPEEALLALGYAGWEAGQLDEEIKRNDWLCLPACRDILFKTPACDRWKKVLKNSGISADCLSSVGGEA